MAIEENKGVEVVIINEHIIKPIELKNIGFLKKESTFVACPSCEVEAMSLVRLEAVTCLQRFLELTKICKKWERRYDTNHYCSKCGCYIGRYVPMCCGDRCISRSARKKAAHGEMCLKTKQRDCCENIQKIRDQVKTKRAAKKIEKESKRNETNGSGNTK